MKKRAAALALAAAMALMLSSCFFQVQGNPVVIVTAAQAVPAVPAPTQPPAATAEAADFIVDKAKTVEQFVPDDQGAEAAFPYDGRGFFDVIVPPGAIGKDMLLSFAPLAPGPSAGGGFAPGFSITDKAAPDQSIELQEPATVLYTCEGTLPEGACILYYDEAAAAYAELPTDRSEADGRTMLIAQTSHFTVYRVEAELQKLKRAPAPTAKANPTVVIAVDGADKQTGTMKVNGKETKFPVTLTLHLSAVKQGKSSYGAFAGESTLSAMAQGASAPMEFDCKDVKFTVVPPPPLPIVKNELPMVSLLTGQPVKPEKAIRHFDIKVSLTYEEKLSGLNMPVKLRITRNFFGPVSIQATVYGQVFTFWGTLSYK